MNRLQVDVIVIGSGIAGMSAAKLAAEKGLSTTSIEPGLFGGLVLNINKLDGMPNDEIESGYRLAARMKLQNGKLGVTTVAQTVTGLVADGDAIVVKTKEAKHRARKVIIASGAQLKVLDVKGEIEFLNRGVSRCADCDGPLFRGQDVAVVGGGDSAVQAALTLSEGCAKVYIIHRRGELRARTHLVQALAAKANVELIFDSLVDHIQGDDVVTAITVRGAGDDKTRDIACTGVFAYIGLKPNNSFVPAQVLRDEHGYLIVDDQRRTAMPGVFAIGAVRAGFGGQLIDAFADASAVVDTLDA